MVEGTRTTYLIDPNPVPESTGPRDSLHPGMCNAFQMKATGVSAIEINRGATSNDAVPQPIPKFDACVGRSLVNLKHYETIWKLSKNEFRTS